MAVEGRGGLSFCRDFRDGCFFALVDAFGDAVGSYRAIHVHINDIGKTHGELICGLLLLNQRIVKLR